MSHIKKMTVTVKYQQEDQNHTHPASMWGTYSTYPVKEYHIACSESDAKSAVENYKDAGPDDLVDFCGVLIVERRHVLSVLVENYEKRTTIRKNKDHHYAQSVKTRLDPKE